MGFAEVSERISFSTKYAKHDFNVILKRGTAYTMEVEVAGEFKTFLLEFL